MTKKKILTYKISKQKVKKYVKSATNKKLTGVDTEGKVVDKEEDISK